MKMEPLKLRFWTNLASIIFTTYVIAWYIFKPIENQCQMTFMMEPPKFLPVPFFDEGRPAKQVATSGPETSDKYRLFMYSEFGFPLSSDLRRDLKDSMPVLFVPGNAGSYQQVRSIASTCIRLQLQSLDAMKFVFYTIDFRGELSGISGDLIEDQISFVQKSIEHIIKIHPADTNGVVLMGHSVGGFISKALFTQPDFDQNSVPLLISLASPLIRPYLNFDSKMRQLYQSTNEYWSRRSASSTIAISINGGRSDHLVPMHLSMDNSFDLSLTTSSVKNVWLSTDHVSVTWCRELIHKLANLLSALMDKKKTCLIGNNTEAMNIVKRELFDRSVISNTDKKEAAIKSVPVQEPQLSMIMDRKFMSIQRQELSDKRVILNLDSSGQEYLIYVDHIGELKANRIYGCKSLETNSHGQTSCISRFDLLKLAQSIPSRRFEPKKTSILLNRNGELDIKVIVFDFIGDHKNEHSKPDLRTLPESVSIQHINTRKEYALYIPSLVEFALKRIMFLNAFRYKIFVDKDELLVYSRYKLTNMNQKTQIYSIKFEVQNCASKESPHETKVLYYQNDYLSESFHLPMNQNGSNHINVKISPQNSVLTLNQPHTEQSSRLEFYIDGTCENSIKLELEILDLIVDVIQRNLDKILACSTYIAYATLVQCVLRLNESQNPVRGKMSGFLSRLILDSRFMLVYLLSDTANALGTISSKSYSDFVDEIIVFALVYILSAGAIAFINHLFRRLIDLATIINNFQSLIGSRIRPLSTKVNGNSTKIEANGKSADKLSRSSQNGLTSRAEPKSAINLEWTLLGIVIAGSFILSPAITSIAQMFVLLRLALYIEKLRRDRESTRLAGERPESPMNRHCCKTPSRSSKLDPEDIALEVVILMGTICAFAFVSTVPAALLILNALKSGVNLLDAPRVDPHLFIPAASLFVLKHVTDKLQGDLLNQVHHRADKSPMQDQPRSKIMVAIAMYGHLLTYIPIVIVANDIRHINTTLLTLLVWFRIYLSQSKLGSPATRRENGIKMVPKGTSA